MKKEVLVVLFLVCFLTFSAGVIADAPGGISPETLQNDSVVKGVTQLKNITEGLSDRNLTKWEYLSKSWKESLLKSKNVAMVDTFLKKIDIVFYILLAEHYDLSLLFLFSITIWIFLYLNYSMIFRCFTPLSSGPARAIAFGVTVLSGHLGVIKAISKATLSLIFVGRDWFGYILLFVVWIVLAIASKFFRNFGEKFKAQREARAKEQERVDRAVLHTTVEGINQANEEING